MKCVLCHQEGDVYEIYRFFKNRNFICVCFDDDECAQRREKLEDKDFELFFKESFGCHFYDLKPLPPIKNLNNKYYYDSITKKYFVHYDVDDFSKERLNETLKDFISYPINETKDVPQEYYSK